MRGSILGLVLVALAFNAAPIQAQEVSPKNYSMIVVGGQTMYDEATALKDAVFGGVEATYHMSQYFGLGGYLMVSRPTTDATFFPLVRLQFSDTAYYFLPSQQVTQIGLGLTAVASLPLTSRVKLLGTAGVGQYFVRLDLERALSRPALPHHENKGWNAREYMVGGGLNITLANHGGVRFMVRDMILMDYERELLGLHERLLSSEGVPHPDPFKPETRSTVHNLRFEVGMSFIPGQSR